MSSALADLRGSTREIHERLETRMQVFERCRTAETYRAMLERFWAVHAALEPRLALAVNSVSLRPRWTRDDVLPRLSADLDELGSPPETRTPLSADATPPLGDPDEVWGCLYVVEGAALGGGLIAAEMARQAETLPCRFFTGAGENRGRRWREFRSGLTDWLVGDGDGAVVSDSAARTFAMFERECAPSGGGPR